MEINYRERDLESPKFSHCTHILALIQGKRTADSQPKICRFKQVYLIMLSQLRSDYVNDALIFRLLLMAVDWFLLLLHDFCFYITSLYTSTLEISDFQTNF